MPTHAGPARATSRLSLAVLLLASTLAASAAQTEKAEIYFSGRTYQYTFVSVLAATRASVHGIATDYDNLARINDSIVVSRVLERHSPDKLRRLLELKQCILLICFDLVFVEDVDVRPERVETTIVPGASTFLEGTAVWRFEALDDGRTRVTVTAMQTPDFWIPPVLGPLVLKRAFLREIAETSANLERYAQQVDAERVRDATD